MDASLAPSTSIKVVIYCMVAGGSSSLFAAVFRPRPYKTRQPLTKRGAAFAAAVRNCHVL